MVVEGEEGDEEEEEEEADEEEEEDRDGEMQGYDINLLKTVLSESSVPVIAAGGAGNFGHLDQALKAGVNAVACGSLFNFGDNNPLRAKAFLKNLGNPLKRIR